MSEITEWDRVDPHADYLRDLPDPEPIPAWMQPTERVVIGTTRGNA